MTILCIGINRDPQMRHFLAYLTHNSIKYYFLNQYNLEKNTSVNNEGILVDGKLIYQYSDFCGVYNRIAIFNDIIDQSYSERNVLHMKAYNVLAMAMESKCQNVINCLRSSTSNDSKPYQLCYINKCDNDFLIPYSHIILNTTISNEEITYPSIYKSISSVRSVVSSLRAEEAMNATFYSPAFIQEEIIGNDIRAHVVGEEVFFTKAVSSEVDYRYNLDTVYEMFQPNSKLTNDCLKIAQLFKLPLSGIDLIEKGDQYYFLEANPSPGFYFYEQKVNTRLISQALAKLLLN